VRHKQARFGRDSDHVLSKRIVEAAEPGATIVLENLKDISNRTKVRRKTATKRRIHSWSFAQHKGFIGYNGAEQGCRVVGVNPRHSSQACSRCGHTTRNNRRSRDLFVFRVCGYWLHVDLNGVRNIAAKCYAAGGRAASGGLSVNQPIVSSRTLRRSTRDASCRVNTMVVDQYPACGLVMDRDENAAINILAFARLKAAVSARRFV
jgi:IS605 OrfB family transposase